MLYMERTICSIVLMVISLLCAAFLAATLCQNYSSLCSKIEIEFDIGLTGKEIMKAE